MGMPPVRINNVTVTALVRRERLILVRNPAFTPGLGHYVLLVDISRAEKGQCVDPLGVGILGPRCGQGKKRSTTLKGKLLFRNL